MARLIVRTVLVVATVAVLFTLYQIGANYHARLRKEAYDKLRADLDRAGRGEGGALVTPQAGKLGFETARQVLAECAGKYPSIFYYDGDARFVTVIRNNTTYRTDKGAWKYGDNLRLSPVRAAKGREVWETFSSGDFGMSVDAVTFTGTGVTIDYHVPPPPDGSQGSAPVKKCRDFIPWLPGENPDTMADRSEVLDDGHAKESAQPPVTEKQPSRSHRRHR